MIYDAITVRRVANGWIIYPGAAGIAAEFTHIATSPSDVARHVEKWATQTQTDALVPPARKP